MKPEIISPLLAVVIRQAGRACFHDLVSATPIIIQVLAGTKVVVMRDTALRLVAGEFVLVPDHRPVTMENIPRERQRYEARVLPVPRAVFEEAYARAPFIAPPAEAVPMKARELPAGAVALFEDLCAAETVAALPPAIAAVRLTELVTWFALSGAVLGARGRPLLKDRLRQMVETDTARDWTSGDAARTFHMSEATLRRKLAAEGTSFTETLGDTRMTRALALLHTTGLPIAHVAQEVGYDSPSQFAARFKERFGINPREVRGDPQALERIGTEVDRVGADGIPA